jgi:septal ring-binding cell division protein DamX
LTAAPPSPRPAPAAARPAEPVSGPRATWVQRAERDRKRLEADRKTHYAIQLELVCEVGSLADAWRHDRGQAMWLLTTNHQGRDCFRVFWGRYPTLEAARKARTSIPSYFVTARNHPAVVAVP